MCSVHILDTISRLWLHRLDTHKGILILSAILTMINFVAFSGGVMIREGEKLLFPEENTINIYRRKVHFYNLCSQRQLQIIGSSVNAKGMQDSPHAVMIVENAHYGNKYGVHIFGQKSRRYLCFSKKSKLISRHSLGNPLNPRCVFLELFSPNSLFTVLKSAFNETWSVGFNFNGKPLLGSKFSANDKKDKSKCYYFSKKSNILEDFMKIRHGPKINVDKLSHYLLKRHLKRNRRSLQSKWKR